MITLPEELQVVLTIFLALGAWCISKKQMPSRHSPFYPEVALNSLRISRRHSCCIGKLRPTLDGGTYAPDNSLVVGHQKAIPNSMKIVAVNVAEFAVDRHQVLICPLSVGVEGVGQVVRWCEMPLSGLVHQKRVVFCVVIAICRKDVKSHAAIGLGQFVQRQIERCDGLKILAVIVGGPLPVVEVLHGAECLEVQFGTIYPLKTAGHKVGAAILFE